MTASTTPAPVQPEATPHTRGWLATVVALLVGVAIGLGAGWLLFSAESTSVNPEAEALVRDFVSAWDAGDGDAVVALMTDDGVVRNPKGEFLASGDGAASLADLVDSTPGLEYTITQGPILSGADTPIQAWAIQEIIEPDETTAEGFLETTWVGLGTYRIEDVDGTLLIAEFTWDTQ